jgi:hypothetical protein
MVGRKASPIYSRGERNENPFAQESVRFLPYLDDDMTRGNMVSITSLSYSYLLERRSERSFGDGFSNEQLEKITTKKRRGSLLILADIL